MPAFCQVNEDGLALMDEIEAAGEQLRDLVHRVREHIEAQPGIHTTITDPHRWASIATTDLQTGLMALTRAVAAPTIF